MSEDAASLTLGYSAEGECRRALEELKGHVAVVGSTGSGKSAWLQSLLYQGVRYDRTSWILSDPKGGTAEELLDVGLPVLGPSLGVEPEDVLVCSPARGGYLIRMNPLRAFPHLSPQEAAVVIADGLVAMVVGIGERMHALLVWLLRAVLSLEGGGSLVDVLELLRRPVDYGRIVAAHVKDPAVRWYLLEQLPSETASARALAARVERLLAPSWARGLLCSSGAPTGEELLSGQKLAVFDLGGGEVGFAGALKWIGAFTFQILAGAILGRRVTATTPHCFILAEEWAQVAAPVAEDWTRLLVLSRAARCSIWHVHQHAGLISSVSAALAEALEANISMGVYFSPDPSDLRRKELALLPVTGRRRSREAPNRLLSKREEKDQLLDLLARLPQRHALVCDYRGGTSKVIRAPTLPLARLESLARDVAPDRKAAYRRGRLGVPLDDLLAEAVPRFPQAPIEVRSGEGAPERPKRGRRRRPRLELP